MPQVIGRIITGHDNEGKSGFVFDGMATAVKEMQSIGASHARVESSDDPMIHKTSIVDYLMVLKGEIWAILDDSEACLKQGDVMIQRSTNQFWSVRTDEPCLLTAVILNGNSKLVNRAPANLHSRRDVREGGSRRASHHRLQFGSLGS